MRGLAACAAALLIACEASHEGGTGGYIASRGESVDCAGAFSPGSEVCYEAREIDDGPITTDPTETDPKLNPGPRCTRIAVAGPGTPGVLSVGFSTTPLRGSYGPRNCGAAWIEDSNQQFVRTIEIWAAERAQSITLWYARACHEEKLSAPDVISSATLPTHQRHMRTWDGKDFRGNLMPDGKYTLWLQVTESEFVPEGPYQEIPFTKGAGAWESSPMPIPGFADISLSYKPAAPLETVRAN